MGFTVGTPMLKLKPGIKGNKTQGNLQKVLQEMFERHGLDPDINKELSYLNRAYGEEEITNSKDLINYLNERFENYRVIDKNGKEKKLRSDSPYCGIMIIKPSGDYINSLTYEEKAELLIDLRITVKDILNEHGLRTVVSVRHRDEEADHEHLVFVDDDFKLGSKMNIKLKSDLNKLIPERMRKLGYECDDLNCFDPEEDKLDPEYRKKRIKEKKEQNKKYNVESRIYKENKEKEKQLKEKEEKQEAKESTNILRTSFLDKKEGFLKKKELELTEKENRLKRQNERLNEKAAELSDLYSDTKMDVLDRLKNFTDRFKVGNKTIYEMFQDEEKRSNEQKKPVKEKQKENKTLDYEKQLTERAEKLRNGTGYIYSPKTDDFEF